MSFITCKTMRMAALVAALLFVLGFGLQLPALLFLINPVISPVFASYTGLLAMLLSPVVLAITALVSSLPGIREDLEACRH